MTHSGQGQLVGVLRDLRADATDLVRGAGAVDASVAVPHDVAHRRADGARRRHPHAHACPGKIRFGLVLRGGGCRWLLCRQGTHRCVQGHSWEGNWVFENLRALHYLHHKGDMKVSKAARVALFPQYRVFVPTPAQLCNWRLLARPVHGQSCAAVAFGAGAVACCCFWVEFCCRPYLFF